MKLAGTANTTAGAGASLSIVSADTTDATPTAAVGSLDTDHTGSDGATPPASSPQGSSSSPVSIGSSLAPSQSDIQHSSQAPTGMHGSSVTRSSGSVPPWDMVPLRGDAQWQFGWPYRSRHPCTSAQLPHGMLPQLSRLSLLRAPHARQFAERFGVVDLPEHEKMAFVCGDALDDSALGLSAEALGLSRVVFVNNYDGLWQQDNFQNKVYLKLTRHMRRGAILVSCTPFLPSRHSRCVLTDRGKGAEGRDVYTKANLSLMVHGGPPAQGWDSVDTALLWVQQSTGCYKPRSAAERRAVAAAVAAEEAAGGSGQLIDDAVQVCNDVWRAGAHSDVFDNIQCRLHGFLRGQVCEPWQHGLGSNTASGVKIKARQGAAKRPRVSSARR